MREAQHQTFTTHDGVQLFYRHWPGNTPAGEPRRAVLLFHRGHEHSGRIAHLVDELDLYRPGVIELASGPLEHYKVSGNLNTADPLALVKALPALIPVKTVLLDSGKISIEPR